MAITKVWIDESEDECTVCEVCSDTCPEVFEMGDDTVKIKDGVDFSAHEDEIEEAVEGCPVAVIKIEKE